MLKEQLVLRALEQEIASEMNDRVLSWHCNAAQMQENGDDTLYEFHMLRAEEIFNDIGKHYLPWYSQWSSTEGTRLAELYKRFKAQEKSPEFMKWRDGVKKGMRDEEQAADLEAAHMDEARSRREMMERLQAGRRTRRMARAGLR